MYLRSCLKIYKAKQLKVETDESKVKMGYFNLLLIEKNYKANTD